MGVRLARPNEIVRLPSGDQYRIIDIPGIGPYPQIYTDCEACLSTRNNDQRARLQDVSRMTDEQKRYRIFHIDTEHRPDTAKMVNAVSEIVDKRASMLTIWGTNGNAKSIALIAAVNEFLEKGIPAVYVISWDLLNWVMDAFTRDGDIKSASAYERIEMFKNIPVLAIDEFQGFKITDWKLEQIRNLMDRRWNEGIDGKQKTIIAMNEDPKNLEPRIYSRLRDGRNRPCPAGEIPQPIIYNGDSDMRPLMRRQA